MTFLSISYHNKSLLSKNTHLILSYLLFIAKIFFTVLLVFIEIKSYLKRYKSLIKGREHHPLKEFRTPFIVLTAIEAIAVH
ncbi:hypothetical protein HCR11_03980 [Wolbachia pipientis]|uniref:hypothetical protein n=1 Tax=Wolbachia TaxID=953 RepID=UPI001B30F8ED|nr:MULTISPECIES: hypothetical protein [Wolbachia]MBA8767020.1 hypothetical protein [Wolbachia pipientis]